jgi:hypothetical protein
MNQDTLKQWPEHTARALQLVMTGWRYNRGALMTKDIGTFRLGPRHCQYLGHIPRPTAPIHPTRGQPCCSPA